MLRRLFVSSRQTEQQTGLRATFWLLARRDEPATKTTPATAWVSVRAGFFPGGAACKNNDGAVPFSLRSTRRKRSKCTAAADRPTLVVGRARARRKAPSRSTRNTSNILRSFFSSWQAHRFPLSLCPVNREGGRLKRGVRVLHGIAAAWTFLDNNSGRSKGRRELAHFFKIKGRAGRDEKSRRGKKTPNENGRVETCQHERALQLPGAAAGGNGLERCQT